MPDSPDATPSPTAIIPPPDAASEQKNSDKDTIQGKAVRGAQVLGMRTVVSVILRLVSSLTLARFLTKQDYGVFGLISNIIGIGLFVCEFSLHNLLIVQKEEPEPDETATIFWIQQSISLVFISFVVFASAWVLRAYRIDQAQIPMLCVGVAAVLFVTLRSVPGAMMERHLRFEPLARAEVAEQIVQIACSIGLAIAGYGAWALMISFIAARFTGMVIVRASSDWRMTGRFRWSIARQVIQKAVPFQLNQVAFIAISSVGALVMARSIGISAVGLVTWSANIASAPTLLVNMLNRVAFPAMSRLQDDAEQVGRVTGRTARRTVTLMGLLVSPIAIVSPFFLPLVFGEEWRPAVALFQWNVSEVVLTTALGMLVQGMLAMGFFKQYTTILAISGAVRIGFLYAGIKLFGVQGIAAGSYCGSLFELLILTYQVRRKIAGSEMIWQDVFVPVIRVQGSLLLAMGVAELLSPRQAQTLAGIIGQLALFAVFLVTADLFSPQRPVISEVTGIWNMLRIRRIAPS
ncbi:MAG: oligosaccharide flippase family protein [Akkermansiaceae bacterium]|nr:oligosaccharide flippase family protein [Armatimonadota bacterium]